MSSWQLLDELLVTLGTAITQELPGVAHLPIHVKVEVADQHLIFGFRCPGDDAASRIAEVARPVELCLIEGLLHPDPVDGADPVAVGDRVRALLEFPETARKRFDGGRRVEDELGTLEPEGAGGLRKVPVVADQDADSADRGVPHRVAEVAGLEIELFPETGAD